MEHMTDSKAVLSNASQKSVLARIGIRESLSKAINICRGMSEINTGPELQKRSTACTACNEERHRRKITLV